MKKIKNKKLKIKNIIIFLGLLVILALSVYLILNMKIKNIYVKGNKLLTDQEIIELAGIDNYPKLFSISMISMSNKIKMNKLVSQVHVSKNLFGRVDIEVEEYDVLLKNEVDNTVYLSNTSKSNIDDNIDGIPYLINVVDDEILLPFLKKLNKVDKKILAKISEIEYKPNEYDKELFVFYMNDGNYVYINTNRLININKYESVLEQLDGKKGILYLDSGNHFEILE